MIATAGTMTRGGPSRSLNPPPTNTPMPAEIPQANMTTLICTSCKPVRCVTSGDMYV